MRQLVIVVILKLNDVFACHLLSVFLNKNPLVGKTKLKYNNIYGITAAYFAAVRWNRIKLGANEIIMLKARYVGIICTLDFKKYL